MLTHLCEQSDWKWIDGMLLGGCLHYGLERYEKSLEWFQRIISLDRRYVFEDLLSSLPLLTLSPHAVMSKLCQTWLPHSTA
jgi:hypothetical protein